MTRPFARVRPRDHERAAPMPGDPVVSEPDVVMDRGFTVPGTPAEVWPWIVQLGKARGGWYLPAAVERLLPRSGRALRRVDPRWQRLQQGDVVPDYGREETFTVVDVEPPGVLVYRSRRGRLEVSWAITLTEDESAAGATRVRLRLRIAGIKRRWLVSTAGEILDLVTIAGMAAGLTERLREVRGAESGVVPRRQR